MMLIKKVVVHHLGNNDKVETIHNVDIHLNEDDIEIYGGMVFLNKNIITKQVKEELDILGYSEQDNYIGKKNDITLNINHHCCTCIMRSKMLEQFN